MENEDDESRRPSKLAEYFRRLKEKEDLEYKRKRTRRLISTFLSLSVSLISSMTLALLVSGTTGRTSKDYFSKSIKKDISFSINNNANIDVVKNIYENREIKSPNLIKDIFNKVEEEYYLEGTPLSKILDDLKTDYYLNDSVDTLYLRKLTQIISTHSQTNPFDKLDDNQKNDFENIRAKLEHDYSRVQSDLVRIADELYNRNNLVTTYLDKSTLSYWISIIALFMTILLSFYQIYQNRTNRISKLLKEAMKEEEIEEESDNKSDDE
ncbi:MAG: hypothetical protein AAF944_11095 [Bacteroidota bacterium]